MKTVTRIGATIVAVAMALASICSAAPKEGDAPTSGGSPTQGARPGERVPHGFSDVRIKGSYKTHKPGLHSAAGDIHGTRDYVVRLKIDGRAVELPIEQREENSEARVGDAEAGPGVRYVFDKQFRLAAGPHKVVVAVAADDIVVEREISLASGSSNTLRVEPVYRWVPGQHSSRFYTASSYLQGIKGFKVLLNGIEL